MALFSAPMCSCGQRRRTRHNANYVAYAQMPGCPLCCILFPSSWTVFRYNLSEDIKTRELREAQLNVYPRLNC